MTVQAGATWDADWGTLVSRLCVPCRSSQPTCSRFGNKPAATGVSVVMAMHLVVVVQHIERQWLKMYIRKPANYTTNVCVLQCCKYQVCLQCSGIGWSTRGPVTEPVFPRLWSAVFPDVTASRQRLRQRSRKIRRHQVQDIRTRMCIMRYYCLHIVR